MPDDNDRITKPPFMSLLSEGNQRFLAHVVEHGLACGRRNSDDFIRHFSPHTIMKGLANEPARRASILVSTTGLKEKIALKKDWVDAATDLQIALDEGETDASTVVTLFTPDDRVRFLEPQQLWAFIREGEFWKASSGGKTAVDTARSHIAFMLDRALEDKLLTHRDIVEGLTVEELASRLPKAELGRLISQALASGARGSAFTEVELIETTTPSILVQHVALTHIWDTVIVPKIAERHGYQTPAKGIETSLRPPADLEVTSQSPQIDPPLPDLSAVEDKPKHAEGAAPAPPKEMSPRASSAATPAQAGLKPPTPNRVAPPPKSKQPPLNRPATKPANDLFADVELLDEELKTALGKD